LYRNLFHIFLSFNPFYMYFRLITISRKINQKEKEENPAAQDGPQTGPTYSPRDVVAYHARPADNPIGPRPGGPIQPGKRPVAW
jgi:hypothetical protein